MLLPCGVDFPRFRIVVGTVEKYDLVGEAATLWWQVKGPRTRRKKIFDLLYARKDEIENRFGAELNWLRLDDKKSSRISYGQAFDGSDQEKWPEIAAWLVAHIQRLEKAFAPALNEVREEMKQD